MDRQEHCNKKAEDCQKRAEEMRTLGETSEHIDSRLRFFNLAASWDRMAQSYRTIALSELNLFKQ